MRLRRSHFAPWTGLYVGFVAWYLHQQAASSAVYWDCRLGSALLTGGLGLASVAAIVAGGLISWRARAAPPNAEGRPESRAFAGFVGAASAGLFLVATLFQALSGFILTGCAR